MKFKFKKSSRTTAGLLSGACFIFLAIFSWGLPVKTALVFLLLCVASLFVIVCFAAVLGYLIHLARGKSSDDDC